MTGEGSNPDSQTLPQASPILSDTYRLAHTYTHTHRAMGWTFRATVKAETRPAT